MKTGPDSKQSLLFCLYFLCHACCVPSNDTADSCQWLWINSNNLTVNCINKDLRAVPQGIPVQACSIQLGVNRISHVRRSDFPHYAFNTLKLNLSHNCIGKIADGAFGSFPNLEQLDLSDNRIRTLRDDSFQGLLKLKELHLGRNVISEVPLFHDLLSLQALWLQSNRLIQIPAVKFMASLKVLSLASNKIVSVDSGSFRGCGSLAELHMQHNLISRVAGEGFDGLFQLKDTYFTGRLHLGNTKPRQFTAVKTIPLC
ncbi:insulin-like growth factor-binding protein complex acid labile subunit [Huso huso]|uniref:Insulin-like growth factor-binding protein complex acid labile subunit n=1 Tax=Huso huso TaxID=61971 RepID=A0ABR0ZNZ5_HUSHU